MRAPRRKSVRPATKAAPTTLSVRLLGHVTLQAQGNGAIAANFDGYSIGLGQFSATVAERAQTLRTGLRADTVQLLGRAQDQRTPVKRNESPGWPPGIH